MILGDFLNKTVVVRLNTKKVFAGEVVSFSSAIQNVEEFGLREAASIDLQQDGYCELIYADEIVTIEELRGKDIMTVVKLKREHTPLARIASLVNLSVEIIKEILLGCGYSNEELTNLHLDG